MGPAVAAVFDATPRCLRDAMRVHHLIDHHCSSFNAFGQRAAAGDVLCPNACGQTIDAVVGELDGFVVGSKGHHRQHRTKSFIAHYCHTVIDIR